MNTIVLSLDFFTAGSLIVGLFRAVIQALVILYFGAHSGVGGRRTGRR